MIRRPPRSTRTDTLFPYTTLFRSLARTLPHCRSYHLLNGRVEPFTPPVDTRSLACPASGKAIRSEEHTSELQSLMRISYAVFCLKKKKNNHTEQDNNQ